MNIIDLNICTRAHEFFRYKKICEHTMFQHLDKMYDWYIALNSSLGHRALVTEYWATHVLYHSLPPWFKNILHKEFDSRVFLQ